MAKPGILSISDYSYSLPDERIARYPLPERDTSKLLIYKEGIITEDIYRNISRQLPDHALLIFNDTRVVAARLLFQKPGGGIIEIFCLEPHEQHGDLSTAMGQTAKVKWRCLVGGISKWKTGQVLEKKINSANDREHGEITLQASYIEKCADYFVIELCWSPATLSFSEILHHTGAIPLPPYLKRAAEEADTTRYQTMYARWDGSVAAPTAGLHFTGNIFNQLKEKNIQSDFITLHVGAGTFRPVKTMTIQEHVMHAEFINITRPTIENIMQHPGNIVAVGTTSLRTIESLYWLGVKKREDGSQKTEDRGPETPELSQWEAYELADKNIPVKEALQALLDWMDSSKLEQVVAKTRLLVAPGYTFKIVNGLITNFHQPQSTLLLLIAAFAGDKWRELYDYALEHDFRFLSYGDGCLLWPDSKSRL